MNGPAPQGGDPTTAGERSAAPRPGPGRAAEAVGLAAIVGLALVLRLVDLPTRGVFDRDQGHDMLVLRELVANGAVPLLGPPTSFGAGHHGALYYYLLAPAALVGGTLDPLPVVALLALAGVAVVLATWALARMAAGPVAGLAAALVLAVSATSIEQSTFLWNPNPLPLASAVAFGGALRASRTGRARWWLVAAVGAGVAMQLHLLGALVLPPLALAWALAARRADPSDRPRLRRAGLAGLAIVAAGYLPLVLHELLTGFSEVRAVAALLATPSPSPALDPPARVVLAIARAIGWPLAGRLPDDAAAVAVASIVVVGTAIVRLVLARAPERAVVAWLGGTILWAGVVLGLAVPGAVAVTPLPVDHYHAWLDPLVATLVGCGVAALVARGPRRAGVTALALTLGPIVAWNLLHAPPAIDPAGDWTTARASADRLARVAGRSSLGFVTLPRFKGADAYVFPLTVAGRPPIRATGAVFVAVVCEALWVPDCAGAAESRALVEEAGAGPFRLVDRFSPAPGRTISVYERSANARASWPNVRRVEGSSWDGAWLRVGPVLRAAQSTAVDRSRRSGTRLASASVATTMPIPLQSPTIVHVATRVAATSAISRRITSSAGRSMSAP